MTIFLDISNFQRFLDLKKYKELGGTIVCIKASMQRGYDPNLWERGYQIKDLGLKLGLYHWIDPIPSSTNYQVDLFSEAIQRLKPDFIAGDNEQWWDSWPAERAGRMSDFKINRFAKEFMYRINYAFPSIPLFVYTSYEFVKTYNPSFSNWGHKYPLWVASYHKNPRIVVNSIPELEEYAKSMPLPWLPFGKSTWDIRQFGDNIYIPGLNYYNSADHRCDWNILSDEFSLFPNSEEEPKEEPIVSELRGTLVNWIFHLKVRQAPDFNSGVVRELDRGDIVILEKTKFEDWYKLVNEDGYVSANYISILN